MLRRRALVAAALALGLVLAFSVTGAVGAAGAQEGEVEILVHGNRADLLSGGDALLEVVLPTGADAATLQVDVDGRDVSDAVVPRPDGRVLGLVEGLAVGENVVTAEVADGRGARITLTNHPIGGPVFSGPQVQPWLCNTEDGGLGEATDAQCNAPTLVEYRYRPEGSDELEPYDPEDPPDDVSTTTTDEGREVPFIVRYERGTMDRGIYAVAVLDDLERLGSGYLVANSSLNILGENCNIITSAEATMMLQEHVAEQFGEIRFVISSGCSGGSIGQNAIANSYPGLLDGLQPNCTYIDNYSTGFEVLECHLFVNYFTMTSPQLWANPAQQGAVVGQAGPGPCAAWDVTFASINDPSSQSSVTGCALPAEQIYDAETNPEGVRCTIQDFMIALWGERPPEEWGPVEQQIGRGFARSAYDNVGWQWGLEALREGTIAPEQFVDVNEKLGSIDIDYNFTDERSETTPEALEILYRSGGVNDTRQMDRVPIIDLRASSNEADIHTDFHSYALRQRLDDAHGDHDNEILWTFPASGTLITGIEPSESVADASFRIMDEWLTAIEADDSAAPLPEKVVANKPAEASDACYPDRQYRSRVDDQETCETLFPHFGAPRIAADGPISHDIQKCALAPLPAEPPPDGSYGDVPFAPGEWERLLAAFPDGACDFSQPTPEKVASVPWLTFADGPRGEPLGPEPVSVPFSAADGEGEVPAGPVTVERFGGATRLETAVRISQATFTNAETVVLARGDAYADALSGTPLAVGLDAPLLLSYPEALAAPSRAEIERLGASEVVLVGGESALSSAVADELEGMGLSVRRLAGADRAATAAEVAAAIGDVADVVVANAGSFADALTGSTLAGQVGGALLLVEADAVPSATRDALDEAVDVTVVGGSSAVSDGVLAELDEVAGSVERISGAERYATSAAVAREAIDRGADAAVTWVATGADFPDALVAGVAAAGDGGPLILVDPSSLDASPPTRDLVAANAGAIRTLRIAGGSAAVSGDVASELVRLAGGT